MRLHRLLLAPNLSLQARQRPCPRGSESDLQRNQLCSERIPQSLRPFAQRYCESVSPVCSSELDQSGPSPDLTKLYLLSRRAKDLRDNSSYRCLLDRSETLIVHAYKLSGLFDKLFSSWASPSRAKMCFAGVMSAFHDFAFARWNRHR